MRDDVPALIAAEQAARGDGGPAIMFHGAVTNDPMMVEIILGQAAGNADRPGAGDLTSAGDPEGE